jgi:DNA-directed RNA polymerase specialized sigma subunit
LESRDPLIAHDSFEYVLSPLDDVGRLIMWGYYASCLTMREIGELLGLCESRVSQKHAECLELMRKRLEFYTNDADTDN